MTTPNLRAAMALMFGLAITATVGHAALAANAYGGKNSAVRQASAEEASESGDDLIIPDLDKPASKKSSTARPSAPARSGSVDRQSSAANKRTTKSSKADPRLADRDDIDQADAPPAKRFTRPAQRNANPPASEMPSVARNPNRYGATQSGAYMPPPQSYGGSRYCAGLSAELSASARLSADVRHVLRSQWAHRPDAHAQSLKTCRRKLIRNIDQACAWQID